MIHELKIGAKFWDRYGKKCHVINVFNKGNRKLLTYKFWDYHNQEWFHQTACVEELLITIENSYFAKWKK